MANEAPTDGSTAPTTAQLMKTEDSNDPLRIEYSKEFHGGALCKHMFIVAASSSLCRSGKFSSSSHADFLPTSSNLTNLLQAHRCEWASANQVGT